MIRLIWLHGGGILAKNHCFSSFCGIPPDKESGILASGSHSLNQQFPARAIPIAGAQPGVDTPGAWQSIRCGLAEQA